MKKPVKKLMREIVGGEPYEYYPVNSFYPRSSDNKYK